MELYLYTFLTDQLFHLEIQFKSVLNLEFQSNFDTQIFFKGPIEGFFLQGLATSFRDPKHLQRGGPVFCIGHQHDQGGQNFLPMEKLTTGDHRHMLPVPVKNDCSLMGDLFGSVYLISSLYCHSEKQITVWAYLNML